MIKDFWIEAIQKSNPAAYKIGVKAEIYEYYKNYLQIYKRARMPLPVYSWNTDDLMKPTEYVDTEDYLGLLGVEIVPMGNLDDYACYLIDRDDQIYGIYVSDKVSYYLLERSIHNFRSYCKELLYRHDMNTWKGIDINNGYVNYSY